ncbi:uncharacterized protein LOC112568898 [Pomacea canaliculata]|uniref:uncharacterized protein LOC112568898 n=1 Tax=Pomacea canaliculata TaxID=400727 RepID=UPI000D72EA6B|nr:uncharacterized protein LOC112568898 [Pomacea canaliculata]
MASRRQQRVSYYRQHSSGSDDGSPLMVTPPSSPSQECKGVSLLETPTRKNKRKLSEPRKRGGADFSVKRLCPDSPDGGSAMSESACSDDGGDNNDNNNHCGKDRHRRLSHDQDESSSRGGLSEREDTPVSGLASLPAPVLPHPFFPSVAAAATTCFVPGFYLTNGRGGFPPPAFAGLPLGLPPPPAAFSSGGAVEPRGAGGSHSLLKAQDLSSRPDSPDNLSGDSSGGGCSGGNGRKPRKNYKNMTRERRVEANARERTRVHTISAAFDALRRAVPSYSYNQKLSKLAILRIACTYIMALARLADVDCSSEPSVPLTFADCVDLCTRTIQTEGRARRRH